MSLQGLLSSQLRAARVRSIADDVLVGLPIALLACAIAWRFASPTISVLVGLSAAVLLAIVATWRMRGFDSQWQVRQLDARRTDMDDSSALLLRDPTALSPLQQLQQARLQQRLGTGALPDLRAAWSTARIVASWTIATLAIATLLLWPAPRTITTPMAPSDEGTPIVAGVPRLVAQRLRITPPAYTGLPLRDTGSLDARAPQGSRLQWTLHFAPQPDAAELVFHDGSRVALVRNGTDWQAQRVLSASVLYRVQPRVAAGGPTPRLHRLDAIADTPPRVKVITPARTLTLLTRGQRTWPLQFEASDDHGVSGSARLRITLAQGDGENITFREETRVLQGSGSRTTKRFATQLDLAALGFAAGDDIVAQLSVSDNRVPGPQVVQSASLILRWPPDVDNASTGLDATVKTALPAYFTSQRQIIIDAEALLKLRGKLDNDTFVQRSDAIGVDQRILRLRYGQFLGEESEGQAKLMPTNDAEPAAPAADAPAGAGAPAVGDIAAHADDAHPVDGTDPAHTAVVDEDHDHAPATGADNAKPTFGDAGNVLQDFGHTHDHAEATTLLDPETRATLKLALDQMWQSELHLRQGEPKQALPYAYKALGYIKQVQQATRIFLARVGPELPPIDESRRMGGDRAGLARGTLALAALDDADAAPAAAWRALSDAPGAPPTALDATLDALQRWLRENDARVHDPLAFVAAIDAVRRDPACVACRRTLRGLLWTVLAPPPAQVPRRAQPDAGGARYLDALRAGTAP